MILYIYIQAVAILFITDYLHWGTKVTGGEK